jgi:uncharacterized protein (TIGR00725 family)
MNRRPALAVIGAGNASAALRELAYAVGREAAEHGATLVCGGRGGVMEAAAQGARSNGGHTIGIIPGYDHADANPHVEFVIATGMGVARNAIVVASADAAIAMAGEAGTLSEIAIAIKLGRPVVALDSWPGIAGVRHSDSPAEAVTLALDLAGRAGVRSG